MSSGFLSRILSGCQHQFAWPRRDENGDYYQLCVTCGSKYGYDWTKMRRTSKVVDEDPVNDAGAAAHRSERKGWMPRQRRLRHYVPVEMRISGSEEWFQGISVNISRSGLLLTCAMPLQENQSLELKLEMPKELTGEAAAQVTCRGLVARATKVPSKSKDEPSFLVACGIIGYDFASKASSRAAVQSTKLVVVKKRQNAG